MTFAEDVAKLIASTKQISDIRIQQSRHRKEMRQIQKFGESTFQLPTDIVEELNRAWEAFKESTGISEQRLQTSYEAQQIRDEATSSDETSVYLDPADLLRAEVLAVADSHDRLLANKNIGRQNRKDGPGLPWKKALSWAKTALDSIINLLKLSARAKALLTIIGEGIDICKA